MGWERCLSKMAGGLSRLLGTWWSALEGLGLSMGLTDRREALKVIVLSYILFKKRDPFLSFADSTVVWFGSTWQTLPINH